jgi:hypothetical protein
MMVAGWVPIGAGHDRLQLYFVKRLQRLGLTVNAQSAA